MTKSESVEILSKLGVDMNSTQMMVFKAMVIAAGGNSKPLTYANIAEVLERLTQKKYTRGYIYRHLSALQAEGFISVDEIQHPNIYTITESGVSHALKIKSQQVMSNMLSKRQSIVTRLNLLDTTNPQDVAIATYNKLVGISSINGSIMIEGLENVRSTIIREFADGAKSGDHVRILASANTLADGLGPGGITELRIIQGSSKGVKVHGLLVPVHQEKLSTDLIAGHLSTLSEAFTEAVNTGNVKVKLTREPIQTYRMVSLNNEKMLLYLTQAKASDVAALIHRKDNSGLIDDAVKTFDRLWETGIDVVDLITQMVRPK